MSNGVATKPADGAQGAAPGQPTISDIAWLAGVPRKTISRAIDGTPLARAEARRAILAFLKQGAAAPRRFSRPSRAEGLVGLIYDAHNAERIVGWQDGLMEALAASGQSVVIRRVDAESPWLLEEVRGFVEGQHLAGVALASPLSRDERLVALIEGLGVACAGIEASPARAARKAGREAGERLAGPRNG
ncbi:MAG: hypothetical protein ACK41C_13070 [Phenylobacterium sp.]|uniref:hypothetical protein n=1 Tax=Phenylobacterium sp. TaxID=1871053 RepID=UPI00391C794F